MKTNALESTLLLVAVLLLPSLGCGEKRGKAQEELLQISKPEMILDLHARGVNLADPTNNRFLIAMAYPLRPGKAGYYFNETYHYEMDLPERVSRVLLKTIDMGIDVNMKDENGRTLLLNALLANYRELADRLIAKGADISVVDNDKRTALMHAAEQKNAKVALLLLEEGLDAKAKDKDGRSVLLYAVKGGSDRIVEAVLKKGADVNHQDKNGVTPLMQVSYFRESNDKDPSKIAERLLTLGARVNSQDNQGWTPLIYATYHGETEIALRLIKAGADVHHKDKAGRDAMKFATANNRERIISALNEAMEPAGEEGQEPQQSRAGDVLEAAPGE